ncbi:hypothetical protein KIN20_036593 [Parelaphostrongylus tenuis]|uniref:Serine-threonine/tyrosine-protein kinase catalytic domain-containing protein n=1 Tax=Parelaphostrongylus tenuis TaxID=148309 RepID=A0AAD5RD91_PARTN|nr:hypothetical protein KIN20_036593 [Parelaphostrongylus tenuis]
MSIKFRWMSKAQLVLQVLRRLDAGERLEKPHYCSQQMYDLMRLCWNINPDHRPRLGMLRKLLVGAVFVIAECRDASDPALGNDMLQMSPKDRIIIIENNGLLWFGQSLYMQIHIGRPSTSLNSKDPFEVDWDDAFDVASSNDYFTPNKPEPAEVDTKENIFQFTPRPSSTPAVLPSASPEQQHSTDVYSFSSRPNTVAGVTNQVTTLRYANP